MAPKSEDNAPAFLTEKALFHALTKSAFEFLNKAIDEFETSSKFSTIHFATAIELFLKAKLMREHWSLILEKPDQADRAAFFRGNAKTVSPAIAVERLHKIAQISIPKEFKDTFETISKHRNKMVHFAHAGEHEPANLTGQTKIAEEQCAGWLAIKTLLTQWSGFKKYRTDIVRISAKMEGHRTFLERVFESKAEELGIHRAAGLNIGKCPSCGFDAVKLGKQHGALVEADCAVCRYVGTEVHVKCSNDACGADIVFNSYGGHPVYCETCDEQLDKDDLRYQLDTGPGYHKDTMIDYIHINCASCISYHSVVEHEKVYVCLECFDTSDKYGVCGYCGDGQLGGVDEFSSFTGCEFCDGASARYADD